MAENAPAEGPRGSRKQVDLDGDLVDMAREVAKKSKRMTTPDYLSNLVRPLIEADYRALIESQESPSHFAADVIYIRLRGQEYHYFHKRPGADVPGKAYRVEARYKGAAMPVSPPAHSPLSPATFDQHMAWLTELTNQGFLPVFRDDDGEPPAKMSLDRYRRSVLPSNQLQFPGMLPREGRARMRTSKAESMRASTACGVAGLHSCSSASSTVATLARARALIPDACCSMYRSRNCAQVSRSSSGDRPARRRSSSLAPRFLASASLGVRSERIMVLPVAGQTHRAW